MKRIYNFFTDISDSSDVESIKLLKDLNIINGYEDNTYRPENLINRAEFIKIVVGARYSEDEILGDNCFSDVSGDWFAKYVCTAKSKGIISGYGDYEFRPVQNVNLAEAYKIVVMAFLGDVIVGAEETDPWYEKYLFLAVANGFNLVDSEIDKEINREEVAIILARILAIE